MRRISNFLLYAGAGICVLGAIGVAGGMWVNLPPHAVRMIAMALPFVLGGALLITGAVIGRATRRAELRAGGGAAVIGAGEPDWSARPRATELARHAGQKRDGPG